MNAWEGRQAERSRIAEIANAADQAERNVCIQRYAAVEAAIRYATGRDEVYGLHCAVIRGPDPQNGPATGIAVEVPWLFGGIAKTLGDDDDDGFQVAVVCGKHPNYTTRAMFAALGIDDGNEYVWEVTIYDMAVYVKGGLPE